MTKKKLPKVTRKEELQRIADEKEKLDEAIDHLEEHRGELVDEAFSIAKTYAQMHGSVTSTIVFRIMRQFPNLEEQLEDKDPRFMGAVFRRKGWEEIGQTKSGSHNRRVPIWKWVGQ
jgi:hypothetical protein